MNTKVPSLPLTMTEIRNQGTAFSVRYALRWTNSFLALSQNWGKRLLASLGLSIRPSVRLSIRMELGNDWTDFYEIWYTRIFLKSGEKIQVSIKYDKNNGHFT